MAKIARISTGILEIPLKRPHKMSLFTLEKVHTVIVKVESDTGACGWGEAVSLGGPTWSEESGESIAAAAHYHLAPHMIGQNPLRLEFLRDRMEKAVRGNYFAKSALENALFDLAARIHGLPVYELLGGLVSPSVPLSWSLAGSNVEEELKEAEEAISKGGFIFKMKTGVLKPDEDVARIKAIRDALGDDVSLRIDANQGWDVKTAIRTIRKVEDCDLDFCEQPVPRADLQDIACVTKSVTTPIMADESLATVQDAVHLVQNRAVDVFGIKITKAGGLIGAKQVAAVAKGAGLPCYVGCMVETGLGTAAYLHFAVSTPAVTLGCELFGPLLLTGDIVDEDTCYKDGRIVVNDKPGFGMTVNEKKVNEFLREEGFLTA